MLQVLRHGNKIRVTNPLNGQETDMVNVVFIEKGRTGGDASMTSTSDFLSRITGQETGLDNYRVHTHPVRADKVDFFPIGKTFPGHINRGMYSTPQIRQQQNVYSREIDGKPTYFKTWIGDRPEEDKDFRMTNETLASVNPDALRNVKVGAAQVEILEQADFLQQLTQGNETLAGEGAPQGGEQPQEGAVKS